MSSLGGSLHPVRDQVSARGDSLTLEPRTITLDSIYSRSALSLVGQISDPLYGDFRAEYICRLQCAPGFTFRHTPLNARIDSVRVEIGFYDLVGDTLSWSKLDVYEVAQPLPNQRYSTSDLSPYTANARYLGSITYNPAQVGSQQVLSIPVDRAIGERFLRASKEHPEWFDTQQAFEEHLFRGLYVTSSTGTGHILNVFSTGIRIFYTYEETVESSTGADSTAHTAGWEIFANAKYLATLHGFEHTYLDQMLAPTTDGTTYVKSPAGVVTSITISHRELNEMLQKYQTLLQGDTQSWVINDAMLKVHANVPNVATYFNPPPKLLLLPRDSVATFFERSIVDPTLANQSYTSTSYSIVDRSYTFPNISFLLEAHFRKHMHRSPMGSYQIDQDLQLVLLPVTTEQASNTGGSGSPVAIINYMIPSAVQLRFRDEYRKLGVICTGFHARG